MLINDTIQNITEKLKSFSFIKAIVLGGSRATETASESSDIDIGIYYCGSINYDILNAAARELDDEHREDLICHEGGWGTWVNCGGWLTVNGLHVDLIMRDFKKVKHIISSSDQGIFSSHYQTGHPHAYLDIMYRGELASCKVLYASDNEFTEVKARAAQYPQLLKKALLDFFTFESDFSCMLAKKSLPGKDYYYLAGHVFRSVSALNQVLFALNGQWCLNEKKAVQRIDSFSLKPDQYSWKVQKIFANLTSSPADTIKLLEDLCAETTALLP